MAAANHLLTFQQIGEYAVRFTPTPLAGAYLLDLEPVADQRGFFSRVWCEREFSSNMLDPRVRQCNLSFNHLKGTLRGMHFQIHPHEETKLVRCIGGSIYDVIIDLRPKSATYHRWFGVALTSVNRRGLYVPKGFAHGYQTLEDATEVFYQVSEFYEPGSEGGIRWNDPNFAIEWPLEVTTISEKDQSFPDYAL